MVARIGGDEFALLTSGVTLAQIHTRLQGIITTFAKISANLETSPPVTVSCGAAEYCAGDTLKSLLDRAGQALYEAKRMGKNRVALKSPPFIRGYPKGA